MSMTRQELFEQVMALEPDERQRLIADLQEAGVDDELTPQQTAELHRRLQSIKDGTATLLDGEQVMRELFERYRVR